MDRYGLIIGVVASSLEDGGEGLGMVAFSVLHCTFARLTCTNPRADTEILQRPADDAKELKQQNVLLCFTVFYNGKAP